MGKIIRNTLILTIITVVAGLGLGLGLRSYQRTHCKNRGTGKKRSMADCIQ